MTKTLRVESPVRSRPPIAITLCALLSWIEGADRSSGRAPNGGIILYGACSPSGDQDLVDAGYPWGGIRDENLSGTHRSAPVSGCVLPSAPRLLPGRVDVRRPDSLALLGARAAAGPTCGFALGDGRCPGHPGAQADPNASDAGYSARGGRAGSDLERA